MLSCISRARDSVAEMVCRNRRPGSRKVMRIKEHRIWKIFGREYLVLYSLWNAKRFKSIVTWVVGSQRKKSTKWYMTYIRVIIIVILLLLMLFVLVSLGCYNTVP